MNDVDSDILSASGLELDAKRRPVSTPTVRVSIERACPRAVPPCHDAHPGRVERAFGEGAFHSAGVSVGSSVDGWNRSPSAAAMWKFLPTNTSGLDAKTRTEKREGDVSKRESHPWATLRIVYVLAKKSSTCRERCRRIITVDFCADSQSCALSVMKSFLISWNHTVTSLCVIQSGYQFSSLTENRVPAFTNVYFTVSNGRSPPPPLFPFYPVHSFFSCSLFDGAGRQMPHNWTSIATPFLSLKPKPPIPQQKFQIAGTT